MKIEKNKIVFGSVLAIVLIFIIGYTILVMSDDDGNSENLKQTTVPELQQQSEDYNSKLDAINALKEVRETNAPSIYDESMLDSLGYFDANLNEKQKERIMDSIYKSGRINYSDISERQVSSRWTTKPAVAEVELKVEPIDLSIEAKEIALQHQLFFASNPKFNENDFYGKTDDVLYVAVDGNQVVKVNHRLRMRLTKSAIVNDKVLPKNTPIYGFIKFQPNRAMIHIENINNLPTKLKAFDLQDGSEGIYIENNFRADASKEVIDDIVQDVNIAGVPQVGGIKKVFQRSNKNVRVTIVNNYQLLLKSE